jgi:hypothetical protein
MLPRLKSLELGHWPSVSVIRRFISHLPLERLESLRLWSYRTEFFCAEDDEDSIVFASSFPLLGSVKELEIISVVQDTLPATPLYIRSPQISLQDERLSFYALPSGRITKGLGLSNKNAPLSQIQKLTIREDPDDVPALLDLQWRDFISLFHSLLHLRILSLNSPRFLKNILSALQPTKDAKCHFTTFVPCPKLRRLYIEAGHGQLCPLSLQAVTEARHDRNAGLQRLDVKLCGGQLGEEVHEDLTPLEKYVQRVTIEADMPDTLLPVGWPSKAFQWIHMRG